MGDVEVRRQAAVLGITRQFAVYPYIVGRLHPFEIKEDVHAFPASRDGELADISTYGIVVGRHVGRIGGERITGICIDRCIEALQFPASRNFNFTPLAGTESGLVKVFGAEVIVL